jgi:hypothetical protein
VRLVDFLARLAAFSLGAIAAAQTMECIEREIRFRSVVRTFASTREVTPNVRRGDDSHRQRTRVGSD